MYHLTQDGLLRHSRPSKCFITSEGINKVETELLPQKKIAEERFAAKVMDFSFILIERIRTIIERDYAELQGLEPGDATKSVLVLSGGIIEGLLLDAIVTSGYWTYADASERFLKDMIHPAKTKGIIQHDTLSEVLRVFRNLIHPAREIRDKLVFDVTHANHARAAVEVIISEVRSWYESRKPKATFVSLHYQRIQTMGLFITKSLGNGFCAREVADCQVAGQRLHYRLHII
jgi:hypothetical protein